MTETTPDLAWLAILVIILYCAPIIVAALRRHPQSVSITILTIGAGWTFIGWLIALIWSARNFRHAPPPTA